MAGSKRKDHFTTTRVHKLRGSKFDLGASFMQTIMQQLIGASVETPFDKVKRKIADIEMQFENSVFRFAKRCIEGEMQNLSRHFPQYSWQLIVDRSQIYIKCTPGLIVLNDVLPKFDLDIVEAYITSLQNYHRSNLEDLQLNVLTELRNILQFTQFIYTKYNIPII